MVGDEEELVSCSSLSVFFAWTCTDIRCTRVDITGRVVWRLALVLVPHFRECGKLKIIAFDMAVQEDTAFLTKFNCRCDDEVWIYQGIEAWNSLTSLKSLDRNKLKSLFPEGEGRGKWGIWHQKRWGGHN